MVNFNYPAKYGIKFQDFGSWVDVSHKEFLEDIGEQPEVFHISSYAPFMGMQKPTLTDTGRVSKLESSWIPIKDCVVITEPNNDNVLLLVPNLNEKVIPLATYWTQGMHPMRNNNVPNNARRSGWSKRFTHAFVETGKMNWDRHLSMDGGYGAKAERRIFKQKLRNLLHNINHSWVNPYQLNSGGSSPFIKAADLQHWELQTKIEDDAREKFLNVVFHNAKAMNDNYEKAKPTEPPYYLQFVVNKNTFLSNLQAVKNQYDYAQTPRFEERGGWPTSPKWLDIKVLTEVRGLSPQGDNIKLLNWTTSKQLLDYLDISPNPLRPFLWGLELINNKSGKLVPYGWQESQHWPRISGLLPLNKWRSVSPAKEWRKYPLGIESLWDTTEAETFEAGSRYPPRYLDLSETGVCFVVTPHFQEQWNNLKRYGPSENKTLPELVGDWKDGLSWFWEELANPPMNEKYYYTKVRKGGSVVAYIYYVKRFNRSRGRQEIELITVTPPSHPTGFGGATIFGIPHTDTTEYSGRMPFNAEESNGKVICDGCGKQQYKDGRPGKMVRPHPLAEWDKVRKRYKGAYPQRFGGQICSNDNCDFALCKDCYSIGLEKYDENGKANWKRFFYRIGDKEDGVIYCDNCFDDPVGSQIIEGEHGGDAEESYERWDAWLYQVGYAPTNWKRKDEWEAHDYTSVPLKGFCPICDGPIPNAEHRGQYPGAMSRFDNETEICSLCGSAEAIGPMMDEDAKITMQVGHQNRDWDIWRQGVNIGRGAVKEMMDASARATKIFKEGKFEDITDEYME